MTRAARRGLAVWEQELGGREALVEELDAADGGTDTKDTRRLALVALLRDPQNRGLSLARLCKLAGVSIVDFLTYCSVAKNAQSLIEAQLIAAQATPDVMRDVAAKAVDQRSVCTCVKSPAAGAPAVPDLKCKRCWGSGILVEKSSVDHQKIVLRVSGVLKEEATVKVNNQVGIALGKNFTDSFVRQTDEAPLVFDVAATEVK